MKPVQVLLVDDHALFRQGLALILNAQPDFEVVGEASNGLEAVERSHELKPDLILMDITMPECDGIEATHRIKRKHPAITIVMVTGRTEQEKVFEAILAGAQGHLLKSITAIEMLELLRSVMRGETTIDSRLADYTRAQYLRLTQASSQAPHPGLALLTEREREVLHWVAQGDTDQEIAQRLHLSLHTVKRHVSSMLAKLHVPSRREAARLIRPDEKWPKKT